MTHHTIETKLGSISWDQVGAGPDLVVLHSLLTDRHAFAPVVPVWAEKRRVNLVDLPGFGQSAPASPSIDAYANAIGAFLEAAEFDPGDTVLVGNGLGAFVSLGTAIHHGSRFGRLCLVGCGVAFPEAAKDAFATMASAVEKGGMDAVVDLAVNRIFPKSYLASHSHVMEERRRVLLRTDPDAFIGACRALQQLDYRSPAAGVANPTLIVVGSEDGATPPAMAKEAHDLIPGSRLVELDGLGHAPQLQDPARFVSTVEEFLFGDS